MNDTSLAITGLRLRVVQSAIASVVLSRVHVVVAIEVHVLHAHGQERDAVGARARGGGRAAVVVGRDVAARVESTVAVVRTSSGSAVGSLVALRGVREALTWSTRTERSGIGLKSRLDGRVRTSLLARAAHVVVVGQLTAMAAGNSASGNATDAGIVVVEMLLGVVVGDRAAVGSALDGRHVVGREGALQLGRSSHDVVTGVVARRRDNGSLVVGGSVREELQVERVAD